MIPFLLAEMKAIHDEIEEEEAWHDREFDPPTVSWNIGINDHTEAVNVTAPRSICTVYFRPTPRVDADSLLARAKRAALRCGVEFEVLRRATPFYVARDSDYLKGNTGPRGTGDGAHRLYGLTPSMFREMKHLLVIGPGNIAQAHTADEWIELEQLRLGAELYGRLIERWCTEAGVDGR